MQQTDILLYFSEHDLLSELQAKGYLSDSVPFQLSIGGELWSFVNCCYNSVDQSAAMYHKIADKYYIKQIFAYQVLEPVQKDFVLDFIRKTSCSYRVSKLKKLFT